ncbi:unnamed protein product [Schistosoma spindalis]|nr:unnamed protein product [Schistosoma spindale]
MKTYFVTGRKPEFVFQDTTDGGSRNFAEVLKEDMLKDDDIPSENSDDSAKFSINLSDASGTTEEESSPSSPKVDGEELEMTEKISEKKDKKSSRGESRRSSKSAQKRRQSQPLSNTTSPTNENPDVENQQSNSGFVNNQNTTEVLNEAARRLVETKIKDVKNEQKKKQDITFSLENPKEILKEAPSEANLQAVDNNVDEATLFKSKPKAPERSRLIKLNPANKVSSVSVSNKPIQPTPDKVTVNNVSSDATEDAPNDDNDKVAQEIGDREDSHCDDFLNIHVYSFINSHPNFLSICFVSFEAVQQYREMVKQGRFDPVPDLPFCSPQAVIFKDLAQPLCLALTELLIIRPKNPIMYLAIWLRNYSMDSSKFDWVIHSG